MEKEMTLQREVPNSDLAIPKDKRAFLTYPAEGLVPCALEETEDGVLFRFDTEGLAAADTVWTRPQVEQLRFLLNAAALETLDAEYAFSLAPENLLVDLNLCPRVLLRDARGEDEAFLTRYKALAGSLLLPRYSYDDYIQGGQDLFQKDKLLAELTRMDTLTEMKALLRETYVRAGQDVESRSRVVSKQSVLFSRIALPVLAALLLVSAFFAVRATVFTIPERDMLLAANTAYIAGDFLGVQRILSEVSLEDMDTETKYFLARSYVITEPLTDAQIENVLVGLTQLTDPVLFDYWILLGRLQLEEAIDLARRFGDTELQLFAYLKHEAIVRADTTMPGDEKVALLASLETQINNLQSARAAFGG